MLGLSVLAVVLTTVFAGCDSNNYRDGRRDDVGPSVQSFELDFDVAEADFSDSGTVASLAVEAPELDARAVQSGAVMAYVRVENAFGERVWRALPYTYGVEFQEDPDGGDEPAVDYTVTLGFAYDVNLFEVFYELSSADDYVWSQLEDQGARRVKVVVISEDALRRHQTLDLDDYEAVRQQFDLHP